MQFKGCGKFLSGPLRVSRAGMTLVEMMVALAILTIGVVSLMKSFEFIQRGVQSAKDKTLASNLAQEGMQILKQKTYYQVLPTVSPGSNSTDFYPDTLFYDNTYFPPEEIREAGVTYTRYTFIEAVNEDSNALTEVGSGASDTGMRRITVSVVWDHGGKKQKVTMRSIIANPGTVMSNAIFNGVVQTTGSVPIPCARVTVVEAAGYEDTSNASGEYLINANAGGYTLLAEATGYYPVALSASVSAGESATVDFTLKRIAVGAISGYPWLRDHLVISQIAGSTVSAATGFDQEYIEIFNPTTYTWTVNGDIALKFRRGADASAHTISIDYLTDEIQSGGYYLFANANEIVVAGESVTADAVWSAGNPVASFPYFATQSNIIPVSENGMGEGSGAVEMAQISGARVLDRVGWDKSWSPAPFYEGTAIVQAIGLSRNELYARLTSTEDVSGVQWTLGPAYDSNNNSLDFYDYSAGIPVKPRNSSTFGVTVKSGTPAAGAVVSCADGNSSPAEAVLLSNSGPSQQTYAYFSMVNIATGSWAVSITSGTYSLFTDTVTLDSSGSSYVFPSISTFLTETVDTGLIVGTVRNAQGLPLSGVTVSVIGVPPVQTGSDGRYRLNVPAGYVNLTANPTGGLSTYLTAHLDGLSVSAGGIYSGADFVLYQGGRISGFITRDGSAALPGVAVSIDDENYVSRDQQVSGLDGYFTSTYLSTGTYLVTPSIGSLESASPSSTTVAIVSMGSNVFSSTFTISGALGAVSGSVTYGGEPVKTGVLIVVTTVTLTGSTPAPPSISEATISGPPYYMGSSLENGTYNVDVRQSTNPAYNVYAYYPVPSGSYATISSTSAANVSVLAGSTTVVNFGW